MRLIDADELVGILHNTTFLDGDDRTMVYRIIESMPSTQPKRGEWIYCEEDGSPLPEDGRYGIFKCSNCGSKQSFPISEGSGKVYADNYCHNCGADMRGESNG